ncbi:MAG: VOC family protein [Rhizobiales bacterium]|nr:VOC family protein [Hyphomicrobiales bacterium]
MTIPAPRPLDHLVLAARDLAAQADFYRRLGFQVGARNRHPWGTENHIVQLDGAFLELISTGADFVAPRDPDPRTFSFAAFLAGYLAEREGFAMLALRSTDARADAAAFKAAGVGDFDPFYFERRGRGTDGRELHVAFSLAFARSPLIRDAGFFVCQQHHPENFWNPAFQTHPNGARRLAAVVMTADGPSDHAEFLSHLTRQREMLATSMGLELALPDGRLEVLTPAAFAFRYGGAAAESLAPPLPLEAKPDHTPTRLAAYRIAVDDLDATQRRLADNAVPAELRGDLLIVPAAAACGVVIAFEPA